jgi:CheY-like chemotaxis protein
MARALVVEDDDTVREVVIAHLRRGGHRVLDAIERSLPEPAW